MTRDSIRAALADMQATRKACDDAIHNLEMVLASLGDCEFPRATKKLKN